MDMSAIETAMHNLANNMRLYGEAHWRFESLVRADREEAINNLDRAFEANLEAFHTLYDVSKDHFAYFDHGDTTLLIVMRNALHHRNHPLFRSLQSELWLAGEHDRWVGASFLLARHQMLSGAPSPMEHHFKLDDFRERLDPEGSSPFRDTFANRTNAERRWRLLDDGLAFHAIREKARNERYPASQVYVDLVPIFISSACRVFKAMQAAGAKFKGFDANAYKETFTSELEVDLRALEYKVFFIGCSVPERHDHSADRLSGGPTHDGRSVVLEP